MKRELKWLARQGARFTAGMVARTFGRAVVLNTGYVYDVPRHINPIDYVALFRGRYEEAEIKILREHFKPTDVIIEVGANIGIVSRVAMSEKLTEDGLYLAVEPNPRSIAVLEKNLERSARQDITKDWYVEQAALCAPDEDGLTATFRMRNNLSSGLESHTGAHLAGDPVTVNLRSLAALMDENGVERASLIIDAEGAEIDMLKDTQGLARIDQIAIEVHEPSLTGRPETPEFVLHELEKQGFTIGGRALNTYYLFRPSALTV